MKSSTSTYESSGSQFFRTSNGIQSGPDAFHESSSTILEVIQLYSWILCSFRLDLEGKIDNEIPVSSRLEFLEEFLAKNFVNNNRSNTSGPLNRGGIADSRLLRTLLAIPPKVLRAMFLGNDGLFCFSTICMFCSFKNSFAKITRLPELYFRFKSFILLVQTKKSNFYKLWQQQKQLKTMKMSEAWPDTFDEGYIHQLQPELSHKTRWQQQKHWV